MLIKIKKINGRVKIAIKNMIYNFHFDKDEEDSFSIIIGELRRLLRIRLHFTHFLQMISN